MLCTHLVTLFLPRTLLPAATLMWRFLGDKKATSGAWEVGRAHCLSPWLGSFSLCPSVG